MIDLDKFLARVIQTDGCWFWIGGSAGNGYGSFKWADPKGQYAHRFAYEAFVGPIPEGLQIDHLCRNRACVNPRHLEAVTSRENTMRGNHPSAVTHRTKRCKRGHDLSKPENVHLWRGWSRCNVCILDRRHRRYAEGKG